jgi:alkanesulfonate monooxygenase SsuD/methylene tetrahydromethanopterin reductase-like flavin-dependent oxidoreductase (luciferase family)
VLDLISGSRLILGIGQGYRPKFSVSVASSHIGRAAWEGALLIRRLWTESGHLSREALLGR